MFVVDYQSALVMRMLLLVFLDSCLTSGVDLNFTDLCCVVFNLLGGQLLRNLVRLDSLVVVDIDQTLNHDPLLGIVCTNCRKLFILTDNGLRLIDALGRNVFLFCRVQNRIHCVHNAIGLSKIR